MIPWEARGGPEKHRLRSVLRTGSGHLFLFRNRRRDRLKILFWDRDGYGIFYKRLARGTFEFPVPQGSEQPSIEIRASELSMLLDGIQLQGRRRRPRYERPAVPV